MTEIPETIGRDKWEYLVLRRRTLELLSPSLEDEGEEGWELVTVLMDRDGQFTAFLKRYVSA